jgi:hypothetical protein
VVFVSATRLALRLRRAHREAIVATVLRSLGSTVLYDFQVRETGQRQLGPIGQLTADLLKPWLPEHYLGRIVSIDLAGSEADPDHLPLICGCQQLQSLDLSDTRIPIRALSLLSPLTQLNTLVLHNMEITDADVPTLAGLRRLRRLDVTGCAISQTALSTLESLPRLNLVQQEIAPVENAC